MLCIFVEMVVIFHFKITHIVCIKSLPRIIEKLLNFFFRKIIELPLLPRSPRLREGDRESGVIWIPADAGMTGWQESHIDNMLARLARQAPKWPPLPATTPDASGQPCLPRGSWQPVVAIVLT
jgi:hypothetical protein